jgi:hypothetical protein
MGGIDTNLIPSVSGFCSASVHRGGDRSVGINENHGGQGFTCHQQQRYYSARRSSLFGGVFCPHCAFWDRSIDLAPHPPCSFYSSIRLSQESLSVNANRS